MSRINRWLLPIVFFGILLVPMLWFGNPGFAPSRLAENRESNPFPRYSLFWFQKFERWFVDRFGLRDTLIYYGARLQFEGLGLLINRRVALGPDGWLFYDELFKPGQPLFADFLGRAPLTSAQLENMTKNLSAIHGALKQCGIGFYFVMPPDKQTVYPEKLPLRKRDNATTRADQLFAHLSRAAADIPTLDLRAPLLQSKSALRHEIYLRTDTHWNRLGAFLGYRELARRLNADGVLPGSARTEISNYRFVPMAFQKGDIAETMLSLPGYFHGHELHVQSGPETHAQASAPPSDWPQTKNPKEYLATANPVGTGTLLIYRDSFAEHLLPFLAEDFARTFAIWRHRIDGEEVRRAKPRVVVLEILERLLPSLENAPTNLDRVCAVEHGAREQTGHGR